MENAYFKGIRQVIIDEISTANKEIKIAVCWFTNQKLFNKLCDKIKKGVKVDLIILNDYINNREDGLDFQYFIDIGGNFYFGNNDNPMHNKYCIIDNSILINGSYNWTYFAESKNEENIIVHKAKRKLIDIFNKDFERIKSGVNKVERITKNSINDIGEKNLYDINYYLANDYLYKAKDTKNPSIVEKSYKLLPENLEIQKALSKFKKYQIQKTTIPIGVDIINDGFVVLIPKGTKIPASGSDSFSTVEDNQTSINTSLRYGINEKASLNKEISSYIIKDITPMKAGQVSNLTKWLIDINGILTITESIKESNNRITMKYDINYLLEND